MTSIAIDCPGCGSEDLALVCHNELVKGQLFRCEDCGQSCEVTYTVNPAPLRYEQPGSMV